MTNETTSLISQFGFLLWVIFETYLFKYSLKSQYKIQNRSFTSEFKTELSYLAGIVIIISIRAYDPITYIHLHTDVLGFILMIAMLSLRYLGVKALGNNFSLGVETYTDQTLITSGIYQYMRNPCDIGNLGCFLAFTFLFNAPVIGTAITIGSALFIYNYRFEDEENLLTEKFGQKYLDYCQKLPSRFFPKF